MHYIAIFTVYCNDAIVKAIEVAYSSAGSDNAETIINSLFTQALLGKGLISDAAMLVYIGIVFQSMFYLIAYLNRMLKVGFLLVISPLITLTYAIDKMGDGKAQALGSWLKEYIYTILIQPFHCIIYFSFISVAFSLVSIPASGDVGYSQLAAGLLAILCLKFINDGEKVVRKIFGFQDDNSKTSMAAGAVLGVAAVKSASKMAKSVKTGFTAGKSFAGKFSKDIKTDFKDPKTPLGKLANKIGNSSPVQTAKGIADRAGNTINNAKEAVSKTGVGRAAKNASDFTKARIDGVKSFGGRLKNSVPGQKIRELANSKKGKLAGRLVKAGARRSVDGAIAMLGFAATYATGDTDMLSAIGYGSAMKKGMDELLTSSKATNMNDAIETLKDAEQYENEELELKTNKLKYCEEAKAHLDKATKYLDQAKEITGDDQASISRRKELEKQAEAERKQFDFNIAKYKALEDTTSFLKKKDGTSYTDEELVTDENRMQLMRERNKDYIRDKENIGTKDAVSARLTRMKRSNVDKEIKAEAKEIESILRQITARRHLKAKSGHDVKTDQHVSVEDMQFAQQMATAVDTNIQRNFLEHSGLKAEDMYKGFGLENLSREHGRGEVDTQMEVLLLKLQASVNRQQQNYAAKGLQASRKTGQSMVGKDASQSFKDYVGSEFDQQVIKGATSF